MVGEGGGIFVIDRATGQFLWATPFPFDTPNFLISNIDGKTGRVSLNKNVTVHRPVRSPRDLLLEHAQLLADGLSPGHERAVRALRRELPRHDDARARTAAARAARRHPARRAPIPNTWAGLMKINMSTGEMKPIHSGRAPSNGAVLTTAGDLVFWGDLDQKFRAFDAESGKMLWEQTLGGPIQNSTITYCGERQAVRRGAHRQRGS